MKLSIIIPMYNVAPWVERCIRSLEDQDIPKEEYELICINDGSPDNCREIVEGLQQEFSNIVLINQENGGVSRARNAGMDKATGKYLLMIDPDDYVLPNTLKQVIEKAIQNNAEVSFLGYRFLLEDGTVLIDILNEKAIGKVFAGTEAYFTARGDGRTDPDRMWAVLYDRDFLNRNNLRYLSDVPYLEDGELIARIMCLAERCIFDGRLFYMRTTRGGSATNSNLFHSEKAVNGFIKAAKNLKEFQKKETLNQRQRIFLNQPISKFTLLGLLGKMGNFSEFNSLQKKMKGLGLGKCTLKGCNNYYFSEGLLYNFSPYLFYLHRKMGAPLLKILKP